MTTATQTQPKSKTERARELFHALNSGTREGIDGKSIRQSFIIISQQEINLTEGAAKTYYTNLMNEARGTGMYCHTTRIKNKKNAANEESEAPASEDAAHENLS